MSSSLGSQHFPQQNYIYKKKTMGRFIFLEAVLTKQNQRSFSMKSESEKGQTPSKFLKQAHRLLVL